MNSLICARIASSSLVSWRLMLFRLFSVLCKSCSVEVWLCAESAGVGPGEIWPAAGVAGAFVLSGGITIFGGVFRATSPVEADAAGFLVAGWGIFLGLAFSAVLVGWSGVAAGC